MAKAKGAPKTGGRRPGSGNKSTILAREAIARFVDGNAERLSGWLDQIADNDPEKAFDAYMSVVEYHVPKLQRTDSNVNVTGNMTFYSGVPRCKKSGQDTILDNNSSPSIPELKDGQP